MRWEMSVANMAFISRRETMRSTIPCSRRNSERWKPSGSFWPIVEAMTRGPAKPMSAPGSATLTSPRRAQHADERQPGGPQPLERSHHLGHLHERQNPFLHARPARRLQKDDRQSRRRRALEKPRDPLTDDRPHAPAHEREVVRAVRNGA